MIRPTKYLGLVLSSLTLAATLASATGAMAASPNATAEAQARYRQDMTMCNSGQSNQDPATCRREAGSALAEAKKGALDDAPGQYQENALRRCNVHKDAEERIACEARMNGQGTTEGSVAAGGILRQSVTVTPVR